MGAASEVDEEVGAGTGVDEVVVGSAAAATEVDDEARVDSLKRIGNEEVGQWERRRETFRVIIHVDVVVVPDDDGRTRLQ